ncbi:hypothetical protein GGR50DRAFT_469932 [Xylaria sp. CBS 124048]|nr:hypothetical protein GGR50DRAFT_469932 [Xylaria sp. CBS 124048]
MSMIRNKHAHIEPTRSCSWLLPDVDAYDLTMATWSEFHNWTFPSQPSGCPTYTINWRQEWLSVDLKKTDHSLAIWLIYLPIYSSIRRSPSHLVYHMTQRTYPPLTVLEAPRCSSFTQYPPLADQAAVIPRIGATSIQSDLYLSSYYISVRRSGLHAMYAVRIGACPLTMYITYISCTIVPDSGRRMVKLR